MLVEYQAIDNSGNILADSLTADDLPQAQAELTRRGLTPVRLNAASATSSSTFGKSTLRLPFANRKEPNTARASRRERSFFISQMAILLETGTPVAASLDAIEKQVACPHWRLLVAQLHQHVEDGGALASAVALYPHVFDPVYVSMISAGEASGNLPHILNSLAELARKAERIRSKIISAMIYPVLLTTIAGAVVSVLIFFVLPRFATIFEEMKVDLPGTTKTLMAISDTVRAHALLIVLAVATSIAALVYWLRHPRGQRFLARFTLKVPVFGSLTTSIINARIFRLIGLLIQSSVPLLQALELTVASTKNYLYAALMRRVYDNVLNGRSMFEAFSHGQLMPPSLVQMIRTGEENGKIGKVMTMLADHLDDANETKIGTLTSIMEPFILIFMGLIIGTVAISLVLPMFDLSRITA